MTQQQEIDLSKELTEQYRNKTLPAGEYYFCIGKSETFIRIYKQPSNLDKLHRQQNDLPAPQPILCSRLTTFIGNPLIVKIIAPVPDYETFKQLIA